MSQSMPSHILHPIHLKLRRRRAVIVLARGTYVGVYHPASGDVNDVGPTVTFELLANVGLLCTRGSAHASRFVARIKIVCASEGD